MSSLRDFAAKKTMRQLASDTTLGLLLGLLSLTGYQNERSLLPDIGGKIDLLKISHHGYDGSNGSEYMEALKPDVAIYTNILDSKNNLR